MVQHVTAVSGFAYGVIGADIHVFANGLPLYLLSEWQREPASDATGFATCPAGC